MDLLQEVKAAAWEAKVTIGHALATVPAEVRISLKMFFAPVAGLVLGQPLERLKLVLAEGYVQDKIFDEILKEKLSHNPYEPKI